MSLVPGPSEEPEPETAEPAEPAAERPSVEDERAPAPDEALTPAPEEPAAEPAPEPEGLAVEPAPEPEGLAVEPAPEPEGLAVEPAPEPEGLAVEPLPVTPEEPAVEPLPVTPEPEPVAEDPEGRGERVVAPDERDEATVAFEGPEEPAVALDDAVTASVTVEPADVGQSIEPDEDDPIAHLRAAIGPAAPAIEPDADPAGLAAPGAVAAVAAAPGPSPAADGSPAGSVARVTAMTEDLIDRGAPWSPRTSWPIVAAEGVIAIILGLIFLFEPFGGQGVTLQLMGLFLLVGALISAFQLWRHRLQPDAEVLAAFRSGSGVTVGLVVIAATLLTATTPDVSAALAVVVGIGFLMFGLIGIAASLSHRRADTALPLVTLAIHSVLAIAGLVLVFAGAGGSGTVGTIFKLLGVVLIVGGLALGGYAYLLRQQEVNGVRR